MEILETISPVIETASVLIDVIGIVLIMIGAVKFVLRAVVVEFERLRGIACVYRIRHNRVELGGYILAALEFMIVSDILHSVVTRELEDLYFLGLVVVIRTAISYFLGLELKESELAEKNETQTNPTGLGDN